ncbi:MAG: phosphoribosylformylglycinamidine cyclo-ligase, partial [Elusimicrobiota bacterium]
LDYYACGKLDVDTAEKVVKGIVNGCRQAGCALLGGETAEMPGFYPVGEYDIAGFVVGIVDREKVIDGSTIKPGDTVLGLPSSGPHSNGYSLIRRVFNKRGELKKYAKELFAPTKIYVKDILSLLAKGVKIKGMAHITGGGFYDNIPRVLPKNCGIVIHKKSWEIPRIFEVIQKRGNVPEHEMYRTLNMGIGLVIVADVKNAARIKKLMPAARYIGEVVKGKSEVVVK